MKQYTVLYVLTRTLQLKEHGERCTCGDCKLIPQERECYHHLGRVTADNPIEAVDLCRASALPGFSYQTLVMFEGHPEAIDVGERLLCHVHSAKEKAS